MHSSTPSPQKMETIAGIWSKQACFIKQTNFPYKEKRCRLHINSAQCIGIYHTARASTLLTSNPVLFFSRISFMLETCPSWEKVACVFSDKCLFFTILRKLFFIIPFSSYFT
jgi:NAD dependent epimerase/dehydratase family enzyme